MEKSIIEWILDVTESRKVETAIGVQRKSNKYERLHHRIDDMLFYCEGCNRVWQKNRKMMSKKWESYPSSHIPKIGKQKKKCPNCKEGKW
tara:strand:- start:5990 stop:6259 length:270 start_codon:yes stop_codon:yes gene_type:complete